MRVPTAFFMICFLHFAPASGAEKSYYDYENDLIGQTIVAINDLPLRSNPPRGIFLSSGDKVARINKGDIFIVDKVNTYDGVTNVDVWVRIRRGDLSGWAMFGRDGRDPQKNFVKVGNGR